MVLEGLIIISLVVMSVIDCRKKSLPVYMPVLFSGVSVVVRVIAAVPFGMLEIMELIAILVLVGCLCCMPIGKADVMVVMGICMHKGLGAGAVITWLGLIMCGVTGMVQILLKKAKAKSAMPLIPYISGAYMISIMI